MALLPSECSRIRFELGYPLISSAASPYVGGVFASLDTILQTYIEAGATTTSATAVTAATSPTPVALTLASATGFTVKDRVVVDVDGRQEAATIESATGLTITVLLSKAHAGTYPVTVEGGETVVREILQKLRALTDPTSGRMEKAVSTAGIQSVDKGDVVYFGSSGGSKTRMRELRDYQCYLRDELASALGVVNRRGFGSGGAVEMY